MASPEPGEGSARHVLFVMGQMNSHGFLDAGQAPPGALPAGTGTGCTGVSPQVWGLRESGWTRALDGAPDLRRIKKLADKLR